MTFRTKLLLIFTLTVIGAVGFIAFETARYTRQEFSEIEHQRSDAQVAQFQRELAQRGDEVVSAVQGIADAEGTLRMAIDLSRPQADASLYARDARGLAQSHQIDLLELAGDDGTVISSAQSPEQIGQRNEWLASETNWNQQGAFLRRVESSEGADLEIVAVRVVHVSNKSLYLIGGQRLGPDFLQTLVLPAGMRALLYRNLETSFAPVDLTDAQGPVAQADRFAPLIQSVQSQPRASEQTIAWTADPASAETFAALPLTGRQNELLGVFLVGSEQRGLVTLVNRIRTLALLTGAAGVLIGLLLSVWISARLTRPIELLAAGAREVAGGNWGAQVKVRSRDEIGRLARAFNEMTQRLTQERERLSQAERVAAWRELARRLANELKDPLFPIQVTIDNLTRAREQTPERFDEIFFESMTALRAEFANLKATVARFSEFAKMPAPRRQPVSVNEIVRAAVKAFEPRFSAVGRPPITPELHLDNSVAKIQADPDLLYKAVENLVANSFDSMPAGGTLTMRTSQKSGFVRIEVSDTGVGLKPEEHGRALTTHYPTKLRGTGLGLATAQSVVSDHGGSISLESAPGAGSTFRIELPVTASIMASPISTSSIAAPSIKASFNTPPALVHPDAMPLKPKSGVQETTAAETAEHSMKEV